jgi:hypothetical protein
LTFLGFANEDCTEPVYEVGEGCENVPRYMPETVGGCRESFRVHVLTPAETSGPLYSLTTEACALSSSEFGPDHVVGRSLATPEEFVQLKREIAPSEGGLSVRVEKGEDGSFAATQLVDVSTEFVCDAASVGVGPEQCRPSRRAFSIDLFEDDECTAAEQYAYATVAPSCGEIDVVEASGYYRAGPGASVDLWSTAGGGCKPSSELVWLQNVFEVGEKIDTTFGSFETRRLGEERLTVPVLHEGDVPLIPGTVSYFDTVRGRDCEPQLVEGQLRCLPAGFDLREINPELVRYQDAGCLDRLIYCATGNCENEVYYEAAEQDSCTAKPTYAGMRKLVAPFEEPNYQKDTNGDCIGPLEASPVWTSEALDESDFALIERVQAP